MKIVENSPFKFVCLKCDYKCSKKSHWNQHIKTRKHLNGNNDNKNDNKKKALFFCEFCGKKYGHKSGLSRHKKICKNASVLFPNVSKCFQNVSNQYICKCGKKYKSRSGFYKHSLKCELFEDEESEDMYITDIVPTTKEGTNEVATILKSILEENKELRKEIKNLKMGNTINNTHNNQQYTINMFLNEKCKNAMNLEDFVEKIKFSLEDLQYTKENGYAKGISNIFIKNLNDMDITERPIHCSDQKRLQFYVKDSDEWSKDSNNEKLDNSIEKVSRKQLKSIQDWVQANPDYLDKQEKTDEYFNLVRSITQPNDFKNLKNIKRKVGENVKIDK